MQPDAAGIERMVRAIFLVQPYASTQAIIAAVLRVTGGIADANQVRTVIEKVCTDILPPKE